MNILPRFVTPSDFENYWGESLYNLKSSDNVSNKDNIFLRRIENRLMTWIDANTFRNVPWEDLSDYQVECFQEAILEQAMYVYKNSDIALDSGYDPDKGKVADQDFLSSIEICRPAINNIKKAGLYNHVMDNRRRYFRI